MPKRLLNRRSNRLADTVSRIAASQLSTAVATRATVNPWLQIYEVLPNPDPILKRNGVYLDFLDEISREPHVVACRTSRKAGVKKRLWRIERGMASQVSADLFSELFANLKMRDIINEALDAWGYGFSPLELLWDRDGNYLLPFDVSGKPAPWFEFGNDNALRLKTGMGKSEPVEPYKFLLARCEATYANPYGEGRYSLAFWPTTFKKGGLKFWSQFLEGFGQPKIIGKTPRGTGAGDRKELMDALQCLIQNAVAAIPDDSSVELLESKGSSGSSDIFERNARYHDEQISKIILGHGGAADSTPGRLGGDDNAMNVRDDIVQDDSAMVMACMDELIRYVHEINPSLGAARPRFVLYDENDVDKDRADRDFKLMNSKRVILKKNYFIRRYDFTEDEIEVDESMAVQSDTTNVQTHDRASLQAENADPEFAAPENPQSEIDALTGGISDTLMQTQMETFLKPVLQLVEMSQSYDDVRNGIIALYPKLDASGIEQTLEKAMLLASLQGKSDIGTDGRPSVSTGGPA